MNGLRNGAAKAVPILAAIVVLGVWVQVYLAASSLFGAADALDTHKDLGNLVHGFEVLTLVAALVAWNDKRRIWLAAGLGVLGTVQIGLSSADEYVGGLHGLFALVVLTLAVLLVMPASHAARTAR